MLVAPDDPALQASPVPRRRGAVRFALLAAVASCGLFALATGFGRTVRGAEPLPARVDRMLADLGLAVAEVALAGHRLTVDTEIYGALALDRSGSIFSFDAGAARTRIEALPWVETADVVRVFPDRLEVRIKERQAVAVWQHRDRHALVDRTGRVLVNLAGTGRVALPMIAGDGAPQAVATLLKAIEPYPEIAGKLAVAHRVGGRRWTLQLATGGTILLPADREGEALLRLRRHIDSGGLGHADERVIDLRVDGIIALGTATAGARAAASVSTAPSAL